MKLNIFLKCVQILFHEYIFFEKRILEYEIDIIRFIV